MKFNLVVHGAFHPRLPCLYRDTGLCPLAGAFGFASGFFDWAAAVYPEWAGITCADNVEREEGRSNGLNIDNASRCSQHGGFSKISRIVDAAVAPLGGSAVTDTDTRLGAYEQLLPESRIFQ